MVTGFKGLMSCLTHNFNSETSLSRQSLQVINKKTLKVNVYISSYSKSWANREISNLSILMHTTCRITVKVHYFLYFEVKIMEKVEYVITENRQLSYGK